MLHDHAIAAIRRAIPSARVGGCEIAGGAAGSYLGDFLEHVINGTNFATNETGTPLDFISFHSKGQPIWVNTIGSDGYIQMNVSTQLQQIDEAFAVVSSYPKTRNTPIIMGEYDPDSCAACTSPAYGYRNGLLYPSYSAASFVRAMDLALARGVNLQGALTWAFEYEQTAILPDETAYFDGFRVLSTQGIDKPVLNFHRMMGMMSGERVKADSDGQTPMETVLTDNIRGNDTDVGVVASVDEKEGTVFALVWHYHDNNQDFPDAHVNVSISNLPFAKQGGSVQVSHYRIDDEHSNSYAAWQRMGSPQPPSTEQIVELQAAGKLEMAELPHTRNVDGAGSLQISFTLPIRALTLLVVQAPGGNGTMPSSPTTTPSSVPVAGAGRARGMVWGFGFAWFLMLIIALV